MIRAAAAVLAIVTLAGCAPQPRPLPSPTPADGVEVHAVAMVIDDGSGAQLCPYVLESYPPQCGAAVPLEDWMWEGLEQVQREGDVRWGSFEVTGEFDGVTLRVTRDAVASSDVATPPSHTGSLTSEELGRIYAELERDLQDPLSLGIADGFVHVSLLFDDGTLQAQLNERYGEGAVVVSSLLQPVD